MHHIYLTLRKPIMRRSYLEKIYFEKRTDHSLKVYKNITIIAVAFVKGKKKLFLFSSLKNPCFVKDDKCFSSGRRTDLAHTAWLNTKQLNFCHNMFFLNISLFVDCARQGVSDLVPFPQLCPSNVWYLKYF